ncbi:MAG: hypothetical protein GY756_05755 [bacterium]|nr:hypothetical protein [bacterium]
MCSYFKKCPSCNYIWETRNKLLSDKNVELKGYQLSFSELKTGLIFFNHEVHNCETTFSIKIETFKDLLPEDIFSNKFDKPETCPEYCLRKYDLTPCLEKCECAYVRNVLQIIKNWKSEI